MKNRRFDFMIGSGAQIFNRTLAVCFCSGFACLYTATAQNEIDVQKDIDVIGRTKPILVSVSGFTGEALQVLLTNVSDRSKVAVTVLSAFITRSQALLDGTPAHAPPQAVKVEPELAVAVIWMLVPGTKFGLPGGLANTAPLPFPCFWMVNVTSFGRTVMSTVADFPPHVALMTATPTESAATAPLVASIAATPGLLEVNAQPTPGTLMPCASTGVAPT